MANANALDGYPVLSVLAHSFSGSTALSTAASSSLGWVTFGDTYLRSGRDYSATTCSCDSRVAVCPARSHYSAKLEELGLESGYSGIVPTPPTWLSERFAGSRPEWFWRLAAQTHMDRRFLKQERAITEAFPSGYVDGSKYLLRPELLSKLGANVRVLHMVRDPAVVVHSAMQRHGSGRSAAEWFGRWRRYVSAAIRVSNKLPSELLFYEDSKPHLEQQQLPELATSMLSDWPTGQEGPHTIGNRSRNPKDRRPDASLGEVQEFRELFRTEVERCLRIDARLERYGAE